MSQVRKVKPPVLRGNEEEEILQHIIEKARKNEEVQREEVIDFVVKFIKSDNRKNPFRNGTPGDKWFSLFRRRHNKQFMKLDREQLRILERIGFTEKVMNTVTYKPNSLVKRQLPTLDSSWSPATPKRKRKPKIFKEYVSSTPNESRMNNTSMSQNETSETLVASSASDESNNVNTDDGDKSQESQSDSTDFQPGVKLEVMDFNDDKWYPVKVVEVDYEEGEVLVHFEKWSNRYDEWVRMDSNRIRRPRLPSSNASKKVFVENEKVIAVWAYNHKYPATVRKVLPNDKYEVLFCDGYAKILRGCKLFKATEEDLKNIQLPPPKKPAPPMGADPLDPDLGPKEERRLKKRRMDVYEALRPQKKNRVDNSEAVDVKTEPRSASPSPTRTPITSKPKESFRVVLKGRGGGVPSEDDSDEDEDGWVEDNDDSDQGHDNESKQKKFKKKKKSFDSSDLKYFRNTRHGTDEDPERWNMEIPEGVVPVQIKDTEGYYRESIIIPDKKLPAGWTKHTMRRKTGAKWDVFLVNEDGRKFRSRNELRNHFAEMKIPFPEENFDFMVGRKMEMIRSQTDGRRKPIDSPDSPVRAAHSQKKSVKKSDSKNESTSDLKRVKTMLQKGRNVDSGDETKQGHSSADDSAPPLPLALAELRTPDGGYTCCGKSFRKENLFQMHMKHYHPEYSNLFGSTPNVADLAYARTVGEPLEDSRAEAMTPRSSLMERVSKYEADRQKKCAEVQGENSPMSKVKQAKDTSVKFEDDVPKTPKEEVIKENDLDSVVKPEEEMSKEKMTEEVKSTSKEETEDQSKASNEELKTTPNEEKKTDPEEKKELTSSSEDEESKSPKAVDTPLSAPVPPPVTPSTTKPAIKPAMKPVIKPLIKPVIKPVKSVSSKGGAPAEAVIVQTTSSPKTPVTITKYIPPGQSKPATDSKPLKVTISSDKEGKPTIKTLLPVRPPAPVPASPSMTPSESTSSETQKLKEVKVKEDTEDEVLSASTSKARPRKRTVSEPLSKKPKLSKPVTGSLEEDVADAPEPTPSTSSGTGSGYRFSRNRTQVPRVALEKLNVTQDSSGRVVVAPVEEKDKTQNTEGRRQFKKFKATNNISRKSKGGKCGEESVAKTEPMEETTDGADAVGAADLAAEDSEVYENLRKEEIINCTCGFTEEDGLMIQCDLCLCWQHGYCNNINKESEVPEKYVCYICLHPARQRESMRHRHNQDWLKEGKLPTFSFSQTDPEVLEQRQKMLKKSHDLSASVLQLETVIHSLNVKTHIATMKQDHPKLYLWAKSWKDGGETKTESEKDKKDGTGPQPEAAIDSKECRLRLLEHIEDYQTRVEDRLTSIDTAISALEAEDPDVSSEVSDARLKQTMQMLLHDLSTLQEVAKLNT